MGLLADFAAISTDSTKLATDQAAVTAAQNALSAAQAVVAGDNQTVTAADSLVAADLAAAPYNGTAYLPDPNPPAAGGILVLSVISGPPGFSITKVPAAQ